MTDKISVTRLRARKYLVATWALRVIVGAVFVLSGIAKLVDIWGTVFKIEDYAAVWDIDVPRTLILICSIGLATFEFSAGILLLTGCYRRSITWLLACCMAFMLPLTAYIWYAEPVADCGCFGDMLVLSNAATFWKNVALMGAIIFLIFNNKRAKSLFNYNIQWVVVCILMVYSVIISLIGYNIQPLVDFRPYKVNTELLSDDSDAEGVKFIYNKDGVGNKEFDIDNLPEEESGWEYVGRIEKEDHIQGNITVYDPATGDDVTEEYLGECDSSLILVISEPSRADLSNTYAINELYEATKAYPATNMIALLATDSTGIDRWQDYSMAAYPCLQAEDTQLKQLARGVMSMVWVTNDTIRWKRTVASIKNGDIVDIVKGSKNIASLSINGSRYFINLTLILVATLIVLYAMQAVIVRIFYHK